MVPFNMKKLFSMQKKLDERIGQKHDLIDKKTTEEKLLALLVELGELANETRCFKYWSLKPPSEKPVILEEYVDGVHFILSLGLEFGYQPEEISPFDTNAGRVSVFLTMFRKISLFQNEPTQRHYIDMFSLYLTLGEQLDFTGVDIQKAYERKNQINHERQDSGY